MMPRFLVTAALLFAAMSLVVIGLVQERWLPAVLSVIPATLVGATWYWSNHFHSRQAIGTDELVDHERTTAP